MSKDVLEFTEKDMRLAIELGQASLREMQLERLLELEGRSAHISEVLADGVQAYEEGSPCWKELIYRALSMSESLSKTLSGLTYRECMKQGCKRNLWNKQLEPRPPRGAA